MKHTWITPITLAAAFTLTACSANSGSRSPGAAAPAPAPAGGTVQVYKSDGSRQCETDSGQSPQAMQASELKDIPVQAARKDELRDMAFPAVCGGMTGSVNVFTIPAAELGKAQARGFRRWEH